MSTTTTLADTEAIEALCGPEFLAERVAEHAAEQHAERVELVNQRQTVIDNHLAALPGLDAAITAEEEKFLVIKKELLTGVDGELRLCRVDYGNAYSRFGKAIDRLDRQLQALPSPIQVPGIVRQLLGAGFVAKRQREIAKQQRAEVTAIAKKKAAVAKESEATLPKLAKAVKAAEDKFLAIVESLKQQNATLQDRRNDRWNAVHRFDAARGKFDARLRETAAPAIAVFVIELRTLDEESRATGYKSEERPSNRWDYARRNVPEIWTTRAAWDKRMAAIEAASARAAELILEAHTVDETESIIAELREGIPAGDVMAKVYDPEDKSA